MNLCTAAVSTDDIPDELLQACFARLPLRSVATVRLVCRRWQSLSNADSLYDLRKSMGLATPCLFTVASKYEQGRCAGLQISCGEISTADINAKVLSTKVNCNFAVMNKRPVALLPGPPRLQFAAAAAAHGRLLFILGGRSPLISRHPDSWLVFRRLDVYDVVANTWMQAQPMKQARYAFALSAFIRAGDGQPQVVAAGGYDATGCALASAELYDVRSDRWHSLPSMTSLSGACKGCFMRGKFYVKMANNGPLAVEAFDPTRLCWTSPFSASLRRTLRNVDADKNANEDDDDDDDDEDEPTSISCPKLLAFDSTPSAIIFEL